MTAEETTFLTRRHVQILQDRAVAAQQASRAEEVTALKNLRQLRRAMYLGARILGDVTAVAGGPKPTTRRVKNRILGRLLGKAGVWGRLWR
jgi:hypothetical protein